MAKNNTNPSTDSWDDFAGKYLKVEYIKQFPAECPCIDLKTEWGDEGNARFILELEYNQKRFLFDCNQTNKNIIKKKFPKAPKDIIGHIIVFNKVLVYNPSLKANVDGLAIVEIK